MKEKSKIMESDKEWKLGGLKKALKEGKAKKQKMEYETVLAVASIFTWSLIMDLLPSCLLSILFILFLITHLLGG